jgi:hypothetical protein
MGSIQLIAAVFVATVVNASLVQGDVVDITFTGIVEWNQINPPPLGDVNVGDAVVLSFQVDSDVYVNGTAYPTRGYNIDAVSWSCTMGSTSVDIQTPFQGTPYFVLRDNDPKVDGFMLSTDDVYYALGVPLEPVGGFGDFVHIAYVTYGGDTLSSLNIIDAAGTYDFTGLSVYNWVIEDGPYSPLGVVFEQLTIEVVSDELFGDLNGDCVVNLDDLLLVISHWGEGSGGGDANGDGATDAVDVLIVIGQWGTAC